MPSARSRKRLQAVCIASSISSSVRPGFFEERCDIYNLYPLLVHVRLFGGGYVGSVSGTLSRFGY